MLRVAGELGTSLTSTAVRFAKADHAPCCVVRWGSAGYLWAFPSGSFAAAGYRTVVARPPLPAGSATASALWGLTAPTSGFFESVTTARQWFARVGNRVERDVILREQAV